MMSKKPILVLQMQRMGDLILSFPLFLWLQREYPGHPLWVVGEPRFYNELLRLSPPASYFPWTDTGALRTQPFSLCINLSHEAKAAVLAGEVRAEQHIGAVQSADGVRHVYGNWQLYRTGLVHANRHNRYHWADLNALDCIPLARIRSTQWSEPRSCLGDRRRIGLFLGASESSKHPDADFWAGLARELLHRDLRPILLGGPGEKALAEAVRKGLGQNVLDLTNRLSLVQFAQLGQELELLITPDTGPMHLASWSGLRVLNLSLGPVNPWETGPYQPGHFILQARQSCSGCWRCTRFGVRPICHEHFPPRRVALLAHALVNSAGISPQRLRWPGLELFASSRTRAGLYRLGPLRRNQATPMARERLADFWSLFWGQLFGLWGRDKTLASWTDLVRAHPALAKAFVRFLLGFHRKLRQARESSFWSQGPPLLRPLFSHAHIVLQNGGFSRDSEREALKVTEELLRIVSGEE
ncbi:ADP-heptose:LPS heptosyltransferase [Desulfonatronum thiosulfatophilum]|uniref:ADP-heptose:LPS heptosyltransferase n=1 Tax=Desulfonatronum thiosulfatophilum TaxID=617002 RepID=A0A1G6C9K0_9BACT|nr:glycosyltransferase family 9 protein [Desulfonatronum thiosulfatophilum]SDB29570.1 ADP-heptose:LPS heptosyltransferase [Desulfonatronum thiosulfatophilum]